MNEFEQLHPSLQYHVVNTLGWSTLRPTQLAAIAPIHAGTHCLLLAPTAGGKTEADYVKLLGPDKDATIVVYCGFVKCTRSHNGAVWAKKLGYKNVLRYPGGIFAWKGAGFPVDAVK